MSAVRLILRRQTVARWRNQALHSLKDVLDPFKYCTWASRPSQSCSNGGGEFESANEVSKQQDEAKHGDVRFLAKTSDTRLRCRIA